MKIEEIKKLMAMLNETPPGSSFSDLLRKEINIRVLELHSMNRKNYDYSLHYNSLAEAVADYQNQKSLIKDEIYFLKNILCPDKPR